MFTVFQFVAQKTPLQTKVYGIKGDYFGEGQSLYNIMSSLVYNV